VSEISGANVPEDIDGISFLPTLLGNPENQKEHEYMYWEFHERGGRQAVRKGDWKLVKYNVLDPEKTTTELYNLSTDLGEKNNVAAQHPEIVEKLSEIMKNARTESEVFSFQSPTIIK
jgi:arylsulfatase A-like enzyme